MAQYTQDFFTSRRNYTDGNTRIGQLDRLWYDSNTLTIRIGNHAPGGRIVGAGRLDDLVDTAIVSPKNGDVLMHNGSHWTNIHLDAQILDTHVTALSGTTFTITGATHGLAKVVSYEALRSADNAEVSVVIKHTGLTFVLESNVDMSGLIFLITGFQ